VNPDWSDFKVVLALVRAGSVAGAARELQVDNSTVSRRLAALEQAVGARLLIRGGREFSWTAEGRTLIQAAETMEGAASLALRTLRSARADVVGTVRLSVPPGFAPILVRELLPALRQQHPALRVELAADFSRADLARGDADIALRMVRPEEPDLVARHVVDCDWYVYAAVSYLERRGRPAEFKDLSQHELVLYAERLLRVPPLNWMEAHRGAAHEVLRVDNLEVACQTISAGGGIAVLPAFMADPLPGVARVFPDRVAAGPGWVVYHEALRDAARVRVVVDALVAFFHGRGALFGGQG
jgi:DNA-binding transcriptional LysR family regulator